MTGRVSVFSDQRVIDFIRENFVPITTDINKTIHRRDAVGDFFRKIAEQGHYAGITKPTSTRQGLYVSTADGQLLASVNSTRADSVLRMMKRAVEEFEKIKNKAQPEISDKPDVDKRYAVKFPNGGMILRVTCRDLPRESNTDHETWRHNFDNLWLTADEVKSFSPQRDGGVYKQGQEYKIPDAIIARIAKHHFVDHVKGEAPGWKSESVKISTASAKVIGVSKGAIQIELTGRVRCVQKPNKRVNAYTGKVVDRESGVDLRLSGRMSWDVEKAEFSRFDWVAYGDRWGTARYNFRHQDMEKNPIGFALNLLPTIPENMSQPKFIYNSYYH